MEKRRNLLIQSLLTRFAYQHIAYMQNEKFPMTSLLTDDKIRKFYFEIFFFKLNGWEGSE